jgi:hypothetical protein
MGIQIASHALSEVISAMTPQASRGLGAEKRRASRIRVEAQVTLWLMAKGVPGAATTGLTRDLSYSGMGCLIGRKVQTGEQFLLRLPRIKGEPLLVLCEVTFATALAENLYGVGAEFIQLLENQKEPATVVAAPKVVDAATAV